MTPEAWFSVASLIALIGVLLSNKLPVEVAMLAALVANIAVGGLTLEQALVGFSHPAVILIGALFVVAEGLSETGATQRVAEGLLGRPQSAPMAQLRLMIPVGILSGFMNNTPIVAMYMPIVGDWARKIRISPSKLFLPLSFAAILGGRLTAIGSSSNLVILGLYRAMIPPEEALSASMQFWAPAALGLPTLAIGIAFVVLTSRWLLPERRPAVSTTLDARRYTVQMQVQPDSPIVGKSIESAGLRQLPGLFLSDIEREDGLLPAPPPHTLLEPGDILSFAGILESVVDLRKIRGLVPATDQIHKLGAELGDRTLVEAVISHNSPLVGSSVRESRFRTTYNAAIVAVHRNGEQVKAKVGDIRLRAGDTLLLETHRGFVDGYRNSDDFYLVSAVAGSAPVRHEKAGVALAIFGALIACLSFTNLPPVVLGLAAAIAMVASGCAPIGVARTSINLQVIVVIACALGLGAAIQHSGAAHHIATELLAACKQLGFGPSGMLFVTALMAALFAQALTNNGAAAVMFPITMATAQELGVSATPFVFVLLLGCGLSFATPIGYQTNLMVYGPGGYRFADFTRIGLPLTILLAGVGAFLAPLFFSF